MANYILSILSAQATIVWCWGFHDAAAINNGLKFNVEGFLFTGIVKVIYNEGADTFIIRLENNDGSLKEEINDVYFDNLVEVIDRHVEKDCSMTDYEAKVKATYHLCEK